MTTWTLGKQFNIPECTDKAYSIDMLNSDNFAKYFHKARASPLIILLDKI